MHHETSAQPRRHPCSARRCHCVLRHSRLAQNAGVVPVQMGRRRSSQPRWTRPWRCGAWRCGAACLAGRQVLYVRSLHASARLSAPICNVPGHQRGPCGTSCCPGFCRPFPPYLVPRTVCWALSWLGLGRLARTTAYKDKVQSGPAVCQAGTICTPGQRLRLQGVRWSQRQSSTAAGCAHAACKQYIHAQAEEEGGELLGVRPQELARLNPAGAPIFSLAVDGTAPEASAASPESRQQACTALSITSFCFASGWLPRQRCQRGCMLWGEVGCASHRSSAHAP